MTDYRESFAAEADALIACEANALAAQIAALRDPAVTFADDAIRSNFQKERLCFDRTETRLGHEHLVTGFRLSNRSSLKIIGGPLVLHGCEQEERIHS